MRSFTHINAATVKEACSLLAAYKGKAVLNAGGTDLLTTLKGENRFDYPEAVINVKGIPDLDYVRKVGKGLRIGALARLSEIAASPLVRESYPVLAEAARTVATPQIRNAATIGGNLCQDIRCWYYRYPRHLGGPIMCARKGSGPCLAVKGDNRYHAIMDAKRCFAVCPSDTAVALAALDADISVAASGTKRRIAICDFYDPMRNALEPHEMVRSIEIPALPPETRQVFLKFTLRRPIDFAVVSVATVVAVRKGVCTDVRVALGAVAPGPLRAREAEEALRGKVLDPHAAAEAAELAVAEARPLSMNSYKVEIAKTLVKRALLGEHL